MTASVASAKRAAPHIDGDEARIVGGNGRKQEQRSAFVRANLDDAAWPTLGEELHEFEDLRLYLSRLNTDTAEVVSVREAESAARVLRS
jgi:hypothetical protein